MLDGLIFQMENVNTTEFEESYLYQNNICIWQNFDSYAAFSLVHGVANKNITLMLELAGRKMHIIQAQYASKGTTPMLEST